MIKGLYLVEGQKQVEGGAVFFMCMQGRCRLRFCMVLGFFCGSRNPIARMDDFCPPSTK